MNKKKVTVGVLMGGPSAEHEVSLSTGTNVFTHLDRKRYVPTKLVLDKQLRLKRSGRVIEFPRGLRAFDVIFNALHGTFGEDGTLQALLETLDIPYTGSGPHASFLGMDKWLSYQLFRLHKIPTPRTALASSSDGLRFGTPVVVKPRYGGSSVGVRIIRKNVRKTLGALRRSPEARRTIVQSYLSGREFTCGVIERSRKPKALPVIEIRLKGKHAFFDYASKYRTNESEEIVPAPISAALAKKVQALAFKAHHALGCSVYSRTDFMYANGKLYVLEVNTLPGLTSNSLLPKAAQATGISFTDLLTRITEASLKK